jgi:quinol monooxygenase YgiN
LENIAMICVIATIETLPGRRDDLLAVFRGLTPQVRAEKGCIEYTAMIDLPSGMDAQGAARDNVVSVVEKWESLTALEAHLKTPHMAEFRKQTEPLRLKLSLQILQPA